MAGCPATGGIVVCVATGGGAVCVIGGIAFWVSEDGISVVVDGLGCVTILFPRLARSANVSTGFFGSGLAGFEGWATVCPDEILQKEKQKDLEWTIVTA